MLPVVQETMEERSVTVDGVSKLLSESFFFLATRKPSNQMGTFPERESKRD